MAYIVPTITDFKAYFVRDFPYGTDPATTILDSDIQRALDQTSLSLNEALLISQTEFTVAYLLLTAHFLVVNIQASSQGLSGAFSWLTTSKSVGSVSEASSIPPYILNNPVLAMYSKTRYGAQYLLMMLPRLVAPIFSVRGRTHA